MIELPSATKRLLWVAISTLLAVLGACSGARPKAQERSPLTILMWLAGHAHRLDEHLIEEFTRRTGIPVRLVPGPESASQQLAQELALLKQGSGAVDVFQVDTTWPATVADYMIDLKDPLADELSDELPQAIENATVKGRVVAAPFFVEYGILYYRTDLLKRYGFSHPPRTWSELETESSRIQTGERRRGRTHFWGYVWQGADYEGLTCNALEWQSSQGGGNPLEEDRTVNVDNPAAVQAFSRARRWVGSISPPSVIAYLEEDSRNIWQSGRAEFLRSWSYAYQLAKESPDIGNRFSVAPMPAGSARRASVLGGWYLGISKRSRHRAEAIEFVKYMLSRQVQSERALQSGFLPSDRSLYRDPAVLKSIPFFPSISNVPDSIVRRPAALAGANYDRVSRAYAHGVHLILTGKVSAAQGAADIQAELVRITGFPSRSPEPGRSVEQEHK
jgi:trehalose/maltose transport system substrate-binding protein